MWHQYTTHHGGTWCADAAALRTTKPLLSNVIICSDVIAVLSDSYTKQAQHKFLFPKLWPRTPTHASHCDEACSACPPRDKPPRQHKPNHTHIIVGRALCTLWWARLAISPCGEEDERVKLEEHNSSCSGVVCGEKKQKRTAGMKNHTTKKAVFMTHHRR